MQRPREILPGVELFAARTPTLLPATHTNSYALGTRELLLVEPATPYEDERREWLAWARGLQSSGRQIVGIFLTHHHVDHVGGASFFAEELGAPVWAHHGTAERLPNVTVTRHVGDLEEIDLSGPTSMRLRVLHTPGHAPGHLCLHDESSGMVVVGDMVATVGTILIEPDGGDMAEYLGQLRRLAGLDATVALPAHGEPIEEPTRLFQHYVSHRLKREKLVLGAVEQMGETGGSLDDLVSLAYVDTPKEVWPLARLSLEAHLDKLEHDGVVRRGGRGWVSA